eukprot:CAMPEP_0117552202 /NCGR_PEP_ID=MMETSP0784-20121206/49584_1 /TAXON_ID=39447 /ORGANISM="" /LENGTH=334 /DNA_ID=CAMNT_0005349263 /DNA_START=17 /DNA_END=1018 /DNA_ORIENTATION=+
MSWGFRSSLRIDLPSPRRLCVVQRDVRRLPRRCCQQHSCHRLRHRIATPDSDELAHDAPHHVLQEADACDSHRQQASAAEDSDVGRTLRRLTVCLAPRASRRRHRAELSLCEKAVVQDLERNMVDRGHLYCRDLAHGIVGACRNGRKRQEVMPPHQGLRSRPHGLEPEERAFLAPDAFRQAAQGRRAAVRRRIGPSIARRCARQGALHGPGINPGEPFRQIIYEVFRAMPRELKETSGVHAAPRQRTSRGNCGRSAAGNANTTASLTRASSTFPWTWRLQYANIWRAWTPRSVRPLDTSPEGGAAHTDRKASDDAKALLTALSTTSWTESSPSG